VQCGRCYTVDSACNHLNNRGGGYECGVYVCESNLSFFFFNGDCLSLYRGACG
jgi:hypothetical protein